MFLQTGLLLCEGVNVSQSLFEYGRASIDQFFSILNTHRVFSLFNVFTFLVRPKLRVRFEVQLETFVSVKQFV